MNYSRQIDMCAKELRASIANVYFGFCKGKFCKGCILNKKENSEYTFCKLHYLFHELYGEKKEKAMNYYEEISKMLGVELGEEFSLKNIQTEEINRPRYKITQEEGLMYSNGSEEWKRSITLLSIIDGAYSIVKLPWKPKEGDRYCYYSTKGQVNYARWDALCSELILWKVGNCFETEEKARTKGKEIMEQIKKEYEEA